MFLNVGGVVLGVADFTVIPDSVASNHGGKSNLVANLEGFQARYYGALAMIGIGWIHLISLFLAKRTARGTSTAPGRRAEERRSGIKGERRAWWQR